MSFSNQSETDILDALLGASNLGIWPNPVFVGLSRADPLDDASGLDEPPAGAYARQSLANNGTNWPAAVSGDTSTKSNGVLIAFPSATASWGTITHWFLATALTGGVVLASAPLDIAKVIDTGDTAEFNIGDLKITLD